MTLLEVKELLRADLHTVCDLSKCEVKAACGADLLSDVLAFTKEQVLLLTGLVHPQVIRTAEMLDLAGIVFVRGKVPSPEMIELAEKKEIPILSTSYPMFKSCGLLYAAGVDGDICD